jgi:hypothetical protein
LWSVVLWRLDQLQINGINTTSGTLLQEKVSAGFLRFLVLSTKQVSTKIATIYISSTHPGEP